jgi:hypothetical protein
MHTCTLSTQQLYGRVVSSWQNLFRQANVSPMPTAQAAQTHPVVFVSGWLQLAANASVSHQLDYCSLFDSADMTKFYLQRYTMSCWTTGTPVRDSAGGKL